jgi:hypothetical protein
VTKINCNPMGVLGSIINIIWNVKGILRCTNI